jgi:hypothetical protein
MIRSGRSAAGLAPRSAMRQQCNPRRPIRNPGRSFPGTPADCGGSEIPVSRARGVPPLQFAFIGVSGILPGPEWGVTDVFPTLPVSPDIRRITQ